MYAWEAHHKTQRSNGARQLPFVCYIKKGPGSFCRPKHYLISICVQATGKREILLKKFFSSSIVAISLATVTVPHMAYGAQPKCAQQTCESVTRCDIRNIDGESLKADYFAERAHLPAGSKKLTIGLALQGPH